MIDGVKFGMRINEKKLKVIVTKKGEKKMIRIKIQHMGYNKWRTLNILGV